jgi:uncharacterized protein (TIGR00369 family)
MGAAFAATLSEDESLITLQLSIDYCRPVRDTLLTAIARVAHRGKSIGHTYCDVVDKDGKTVALASGLFMIVEAGSSS